MGVRGKMLFCGNKFLLTITNKKELVYELEFTTIIEDTPRQGSTDVDEFSVLWSYIIKASQTVRVALNKTS